MVQGKILQRKILYNDLYILYKSHILRMSLDILQRLLKIHMEIHMEIHMKINMKINRKINVDQR